MPPCSYAWSFPRDGRSQLSNLQPACNLLEPHRWVVGDAAIRAPPCGKRWMQISPRISTISGHPSAHLRFSPGPIPVLFAGPTSLRHSLKILLFFGPLPSRFPHPRLFPTVVLSYYHFPRRRSIGNKYVLAIGLSISAPYSVCAAVSERPFDKSWRPSRMC